MVNKKPFLLGSREQAGDHDIDVYSPQSPLGGAVLAQAVGTEVGYTLPNGKSLTVRVEKSDPFTQQLRPDVVPRVRQHRQHIGLM